MGVYLLVGSLFYLCLGVRFQGSDKIIKLSTLDEFWKYSCGTQPCASDVTNAMILFPSKL